MQNTSNVAARISISSLMARFLPRMFATFTQYNVETRQGSMSESAQSLHKS